ncbi:MAG TPA: pentapeptide repeat-containing protein [Patescibacteria group bacterium]|nr:pentapeptide repeat-containing protein [Patescibacteria group bacterium]
MSITIRSIDGRDLYIAQTATDVRQAVEEAAAARADLTGAYLTRADLTGADLTGAYLTRADLTGAYLTRASGINSWQANDLLMLREQPGAIRAYKLVDAAYRSPIQSTGKLVYAVGATVEVETVEPDDTVQCGAGVNLATLPWCMREWQPGRRILVVEFTAADIVAIPVGDGKFRVRRCTVIRELDLVEIGLVAPAGESAVSA